MEQDEKKPEIDLTKPDITKFTHIHQRFETLSEKMYNEIMIEEGLVVFKPSWPDFIVINPLKQTYSFVELKTNNSVITKKQLDTFKLLSSTGNKVHVVRMKLIYKTSRNFEEIRKTHKLIETEVGYIYLDEQIF